MSVPVVSVLCECVRSVKSVNVRSVNVRSVNVRSVKSVNVKNGKSVSGWGFQ